MKIFLSQFDDSLLNNRWCWLALETPSEPVKAEEQEDRAEEQKQKLEKKEEREKGPAAPKESPEELVKKATDLLNASDKHFMDLLLHSPEYPSGDTQKVAKKRLEEGSAIEKNPAFRDPIEKNSKLVSGEVTEITKKQLE